jgi:formylmethanofuran dehydrogenase subunit D
MKFIMNTGRTIRQGKHIESKLGSAYSDETGTCFMHPMDMLALCIDENENVKAFTDVGEVVLSVLIDEGLPEGMVFIPYGRHCNAILPSTTHSTGMPDYKHSIVEIAPTIERRKSAAEMMEEMGGVPYADY